MKMMAQLLKFALGGVLAASATLAMADSTMYLDGDNDQLDFGESYVIAEVVPVGDFIDTHTFDLGDTGSTAISAVTLSLGEQFDFDEVSASLMGGGQEFAVDFDGSTVIFALATNETYTLTVEGVASGTFGGIYSAAIAPVPEPGQWALMLAGVGLVGWVRRKRKIGT